MQVNKIYTSLLLFAAIVFTQHAFAASYCPVTADGKIRIDQCIYSTNEACMEVSEKDCVVDRPPTSTKAPYCLMAGAFEICDKYQDYESCEQDAKKLLGSCVVNTYYENPNK